jgi:hypothetical protein
LIVYAHVAHHSPVRSPQLAVLYATSPGGLQLTQLPYDAPERGFVLALVVDYALRLQTRTAVRKGDYTSFFFFVSS